MFKKIYFSILTLTALLCFGTPNAWGETLNEGFEGDFLPEGWNSIHVSGSASWVSYSSNWSNYGYNSKTCARISWSTSGTGDNYLITPQLRPQTGESLSLRVKSTSYGGTTFEVLVSTTNNSEASSFASFSPAKSYASNGGISSSVWDEIVVDLSDYVGQDIYIAFRATDNNGDAIMIDDVAGVSLKPETCPKTSIPEASEITTTSAVISWTENGSAEKWNLQYKKSSASDWTTVSGLTSTSYELTGLETGKVPYDYQVQADCEGGELSGWKAGESFKTDCGKIDIPAAGWTYSFEAADGAVVGELPGCWEKISSTAYPKVISGTVKHGSNSLEFYGMNMTQILIFPEFKQDLSNLKISFWYKIDSDQKSYTAIPKIGYVDNESNFTEIEAVASEKKTTYTRYEKDLSGISSDAKRFAIKFQGTNSTRNGIVFIDSIKAVVMQDCSAPQNVVLSGSSISTADFTWDANAGVDSYKYCVVAQGEAPDWSGDLSTATNSIHVEGLTPGDYTFYTMCACGDTPSDAVNFSIVSCPAVTAVTLSDKKYNAVTVNWTSGADACDVRYKAGAGEWNTDNSNIAADHLEISGLIVGTEYTFEVKPSCGAGWVAAGETYTPAYGIPTPSVSGETDAQATVSWAAVPGANSYEYVVMPGSIAADWTSPESTDETSATLSGLVGGSDYTVYVRSVYGANKSEAASAAFTTTTVAPSSLTKGEITANTATYTWSNTGSATKYQWACKASGTPESGDWSSPISVLTATATGLSGNTNYTFYVRAYYADGKTSAYVSNAFKTELGTLELPYTENFTSSATPDGWDNSTYATTYPWEPNSGSRVGSSGYSMQFYATGSGTADLLTPSINLSEDAYLKFYIKNASGLTGKVYIVISGTPTEIFNIPTKASFEQQKIDLSDYTGNVVKFLFRGTANGSYSSIFMDNFEVSAKPCPAPTSLTKVENPEGAVISWNAGGDEDSRYQWVCVENGAGEPVDGWTLLEEGVRSVTITGKTPGETYDCYVRSYCASTKQSTASMISFTPQCMAPSGITKTAETYNSLTIEWAGDAKALRYQVTGDADWRTPVAFSPAQTSYSFSNMETGSDYTIQVQAECDEADDKWSSSFVFTPTCKVPTALEVPDATITTTTAKVNWTAGNGEAAWKLQYKTADGEWSDPIDVTTTPTYTLSGLTPATTYQVRVAAACNATYTSPVEFDTQCAVVTSFPWEENFESRTAGTIVKCWDNSGSATSDAASNPSYVWGVYSYGGNKMIRMYNYYVHAGSALINTPSIAIPDDEKEYELSFEYAHNASCGTFFIKVTKDAGTNWTDLASYSKGSGSDEDNPGTFTPITLSLEDYAGETIMIQFYTEANFGSGAIFVDNVKVAEKPSCLAPTLVNASSITKNSASISWINGNTEDEWKLQYSVNSDMSSATIVSDITAKPYLLEGLLPQTTYYVQVKAVCDVESEWSTKSSFTTDCDFVDMPLVEGFANTLPDCWKLAASGASNWVPYTGLYNTASPSMQFNANTEEENYADLISPFIDINDDANLKFALKNDSYYGTVTGEVYADNGSEVTKIFDMPTTSSWEIQTVDLTDYVGQKVRFIFRAYGNTKSYSYMYIDDVNVDVKPCDAPAFAAANVSVTADGAVISCAADKWNLQYRTNGVGDWTAVENLTVANHTLTGLTSGTTYEVQVQTVCSATRKSAWTASQTFTPQCLAPTELSVTTDINTASVSWTGDAGKLQYREYKAEEPLNEWTTISESVVSPYELTGLSANTKYEVRVQAACAATEEDAWSATTSFTTWCGLQDAAELPLNIESFTAVPECWEINFVGEYSGIANNKIYFYGNAEQMAVLPAYDIELNKLSVTFGYSTTASLEFGYLDEPNGAFHAFASQPASGEELNLENEAAAVKYIAVRYTSTSANASGSITSVQLRKTPTCVKPTDVTATPAVGAATINWTSEAEAWKLQYKLASAASWSEAINVAAKPYNLTGLAQGTTYKVRVQAACAGDETSDWSDEASFTTDCEAVAALPFIETFDAALSNCWNITDDNTSTYAHSVYSGALNLPGGKAASGHLVVLPEITASLTNAVMTIEYTATAGANYATPQVGYINGDFVELAALEKSNSATEARIPLATANGYRLALRYDDGTSEGTFAIREIRILNQLTLADSENNSAVLAANNGQTLDVTIGRTFKRADYFNTLCLPFNLSEEELANSPFAGAELWTFKYASVVNDELQVRIQQETSVKAGRPYLILFGAGDDLVNPLFKNVTITATSGEQMNYENISFVGTLSPVLFSATTSETYDRLFLKANNTLAWANADGNVRSFRAYFEISAGVLHGAPIRRGMRARIVTKEEVATGIDEINSQSVDNNIQKVLEGDQVIIIRNGVKYTIQGQVISK